MKLIFDYNTIERRPQIISDYLSVVREHFSTEDKVLIFLRRKTGRNIPIRKYAITNKGCFDLPFFDEIYNHVKKTFPSLQISVSKKLLELISDKLIANEPVELGLVPRDYQTESASAALQKGKGIIVLPTSAGKTLVIALIASTILKEKDYNILVLVPDIQLVQQTYQDFLDYGISEDLVSKWTGNHEFQLTKIVVANNQILLSKKQDTELLKRFQVAIVDESHKMASADKISKLIKSLDFKHMFGFTGSLPEDKFDVWSLNRIFGSIIYHKKSVELRQDKYISKVRVVGLELNYKIIPKFTRASISEPTAGYEEEINWIQTCDFRNQTIKKLVCTLSTNTLILVDRIAHGEILFEFLKANTDKQIYFVQGSVEVEEREKIKSLMEETNGIVCIAISKIFSTGISIKNLHNIIFGFIGKARIKIIQSIGRSLRLHHTKETATIFDLADTCLHYGHKHYNERKRLYETENIPLISREIYEK